MKQNKLALLLKTGLMNQWRLEELRHGGKARNRMLLMGVVYFVLAVMFISYAGGLAFALCYLGLSRTVPSFALCVVSLLVLAFTMIKTNGILFGYRDYELLAAMPISAHTLVASRFLMMYLMNVLGSMVVMLPMGIVTGVYTGQAPMFYLLWVVVSLVAPLIPTAIAALLGAAIMAVSSRLPHSSLFVVVFSLLAVAGFSAVTFLLAGNAETMEMADFAALGVMLDGKFQSIYPLCRLFSSAANEGNLVSFLLFLLCSVAVYGLFTFFLASRYRWIQSRLASHRTRSHYQLSHLGQSTPFMALMRKERKRFFSSSVYMLNLGIGLILLIVISVAVLFMPLDSILGGINLPDGVELGFVENKLQTIVPFVISALLGMSCTTCVSLSLEGKHFWILQSAPIAPALVFGSKIAFQLSLALPCSLISSLLFSIRFASNPLSVVLFFLYPMAFTVFMAVFGMFVNRLLPNRSWESEITIVKQSANSMAGIFGGLLIPVLGGVLLCNLPEGFELPVGLAFHAILLLAAGVLYRRLCNTRLQVL